MCRARDRPRRHVVRSRPPGDDEVPEGTRCCAGPNDDGRSAPCWKTMATSAFAPVPRRWCHARRSAHRATALPRRAPRSARDDDVLPLPDGPMTATNSPSAMSRSTAWRAVVPPMPTEAWSRTTAATAIGRVPCVPRMYSAHSPRAPNLPRRSRRIGVLPRRQARRPRSSPRRSSPRNRVATSATCRRHPRTGPAVSVPGTRVGHTWATTTSPSGSRGGLRPLVNGQISTRSGARRRSRSTIGIPTSICLADAPGTEQLPRRRRSSARPRATRLRRPATVPGLWRRRCGGVWWGETVVRPPVGGRPQNGPARPPCVVERRRDVESVVAVRSASTIRSIEEVHVAGQGSPVVRGRRVPAG